MTDDLDSTDAEPAADPFRDVPWWTWGLAASPAKGGAEPDIDIELSSGDGDDSHDIATILRRALMDLSAALQEIERQLASIPGDAAAPTRA